MITEKIICDALNRKYINNCKYKLSNAFIFRKDWESDFFVQKANGYAYEFEVKISRSDFFNDKKKIDKHLILSTGKYISKGQTSIWNNDLFKREYIDTSKEVEHEFRPNKFFYVVPENLISVNEVPEYAGLMYFKNGAIATIKDAPFIHKNKLEFEKVLCEKFYNYWLNAKYDLRILQQELAYLKKAA